MTLLDNADMKTEGSENIFGLFQYIAKEEVESEITNTEKANSDLKTTSVRLQDKQLQVFDAVIRAFGLTRNEAFSYALTQFMADAMAGYAIGRAEAFKFQDFEEAARDEYANFIHGLNLDEDMKEYLSRMTTYEFLKRLGVEE